MATASYIRTVPVLHAERVLYFLIDFDREVVAPPIVQSMYGCDGDELERFFPRFDAHVLVLGSMWARTMRACQGTRRVHGTITDWSWFADYLAVSRAVRAAAATRDEATCIDLTLE